LESLIENFRSIFAKKENALFRCANGVCFKIWKILTAKLRHFFHFFLLFNKSMPIAIHCISKVSHASNGPISRECPSNVAEIFTKLLAHAMAKTVPPWKATAWSMLPHFSIKIDKSAPKVAKFRKLTESNLLQMAIVAGIMH
jgi:hypothetical protein